MLGSEDALCGASQRNLHRGSPSRLMSGLCHIVTWPGDKRQLLAGDHVINLSSIPQSQGPRGGVMNDGKREALVKEEGKKSIG